jgi:hypothetical protein
MKTSATTTVCRVHLPTEDGQHLDVVCKRSRSRQRRRRLFSIFRTSRPMRTWRRAHMLLDRQISTARPLAVVERRRFGLLLDSVIFTEFLRGAVNLENLLTVHMRGQDNRQAYRIKSQVSAALVAFLVRLRGVGLFHRDLKALNVIVQWDRTTGEPPRISLVDLDGIKPTWMSLDGGWKHMLMRLNVSVDAFRRVHRTDRLRLLKTFLKASSKPIPWKQAWRELDVLSEKKRRIQSRHQERSFKKYGRF